MQKVRINRSPEAKQRARELRNGMSVSEQWLWTALRSDALGARFRRQYRLGPYFLDFYAPSARLCVEVDGEQHGDRVEADARHDAYLAEHGILTLRIPSLDLFEKDTDRYTAWVSEIRRLVQERQKPDSPSPSTWETTPVDFLRPFFASSPSLDPPSSHRSERKGF